MKLILLIACVAVMTASAQLSTNATKLRGNAICNPSTPVTDGTPLVWNAAGKCWRVGGTMTGADIATPSAPNTGLTTSYYKAGVLCSISVSQGEKCVGGAGGSMTWPAAAGIPVYAGSSAWGTSLTATSGLYGIAYTAGVPSITLLGTAATQPSTAFQAALTNYSTIAGLAGYPSTFPPTNSGDWAGTWQSHAPSYFQTALTNYSTISGLSGYPSTFAPNITLTTTGSSGPATWNGSVLNIPQYAGGGSMTWPAAPGISVCTGTPCTAWGTSLTPDTAASNDTVVKRDSTGGIAATQFNGGTTFSVSGGESTAAATPALNTAKCWFDSTEHAGIACKANNSATVFRMTSLSPTVLGYLDPTSSVQTQLNGKAASNASTQVNSQTCALGSTCTITADPTSAKYKTRVCEIHIWGSGTSQVLQDADDEAASCYNGFGATETITAVACWANAGSPTVTPVITGGGTILSGALTCGTASIAAGTLSGTPTLSSTGTIDANVTSAGGTATNIRIFITLTR